MTREKGPYDNSEEVEEFVPASQLREAVEALEELRRDVDRVLDGEGEDHYGALRKMRSDRRYRRGQS